MLSHIMDTIFARMKPAPEKETAKIPLVLETPEKETPTKAPDSDKLSDLETIDLTSDESGKRPITDAIGQTTEKPGVDVKDQTNGEPKGGVEPVSPTEKGKEPKEKPVKTGKNAPVDVKEPTPSKPKEKRKKSKKPCHDESFNDCNTLFQKLCSMALKEPGKDKKDPYVVPFAESFLRKSFKLDTVLFI